MKGIALGSSIHCSTEFSTLKKVLMVKPSFMEINEAINETQKHYQETNIDTSLALQQHETFVHELNQHGVEASLLPAEPSLHEQVFTRDIAFTIHDQLFLGSMRERVRQEETTILKDWLQENSIPFQNAIPGFIEGGDVVIDGSTIWVGKSGRTSLQAIEHLQTRLPSFHIELLKLRSDILHLDCVFNIISDHTALVYPEAFAPKDFRKIKSRFEIIPVTKEEQFHMGPNVLSIGNKKIISLPQNDRLNHEIESKGFDIIPVDLSEIIKSGGSFRCCTLPLQRE
ncbi:dimethylarginine dimethylaminohydrolase family protein [Alkalihalobacillus sp. TS-13]|uniref:dimethylarginine dimethylaminohydrolase family protein n=1 Tax=Alkalihalobacillus sp. TS-13 TaxID=2842455 RepID=UPI001C88D7D1|nr:arginine deiminase family protein [Alkalihalobacillus sp. TS-13]